MARVNYENALKIMDIYKQQTDNLNALYEKQDKMLGMELDDFSEKLQFQQAFSERTMRRRRRIFWRERLVELKNL